MSCAQIQPIKRSLSTVASTATKAQVIPTTIRAAILLSRQPIVSRDQNLLEKVYHYYQQELERRLMWTFPRWYYFRRGTLSERRFISAQKGPVSKQSNVWFPRGAPDIRGNRDRRAKEELVIPKQEADENNENDISRPVVPNPRRTEADDKNDTKSLERALPYTLYLLVKHTKYGWKFPSFPVTGTKDLHVTAEEGLRLLGGQAINTWTISNTPSAVLKYNGKQVVDSTETTDNLEREYVIKSRILSGVFRPSSKEVEDFAWLTREEIPEYVGNDYYKSIDSLLYDV